MKLLGFTSYVALKCFLNVVKLSVLFFSYAS